MKNLFYTMILALNLITLHGYSQCNVQINNRSDGTTVKYLNPEMVGAGTGCELGVSISTNGTDYFFNTAIRYANTSVKSIGTLLIRLSNNQSLNLKLYNCELATLKNSEVAMAVYFSSQSDVEKLKSSAIQKIIFKESTGRNQIVILSKNFTIATKQINCLENI